MTISNDAEDNEKTNDYSFELEHKNDFSHKVDPS